MNTNEASSSRSPFVELKRLLDKIQIKYGNAEDARKRDVVREVHKKKVPHYGAGCRYNSRLSSTGWIECN